MLNACVGAIWQEAILREAPYGILADPTRLGESTLMILKFRWVSEYASTVFAFDSVGVDDEVGAERTVFGVLQTARDQVRSKIEAWREEGDDSLVNGTRTDRTSTCAGNEVLVSALHDAGCWLKDKLFRNAILVGVNRDDMKPGW
jgi:hypothetical protein